MIVQTITRYKYNDVEYPTLQKVKEHIENKIGSDIIDSFGILPPKTRLDILKVLTSKESRKLLVELLTTTYDYEDKDYRIITKNILDL